MSNDETPPAQSLRDRLREVLPANAHYPSQGVFGWSVTWTTPEGLWSVAVSFGAGATISGPGGEWQESRPGAGLLAERVVVLLRAMVGIPAEPEAGP